MVRRLGTDIATPREWKEYTKLTDRANRRIKAAAEEFGKYNTDILPYDLTGDWQMKQDWKTEKQPISKSKGQFNSRAEFRVQLSKVRKLASPTGDTITTYLKKQTDKTILGIRSAIGVMTPELEGHIRLMNPIQQNRFWAKYHYRSREMGNSFSSDALLTQMIKELLPEDIYSIVQDSITTALSEQPIQPPRGRRNMQIEDYNRELPDINDYI